MSLLFLVNNSTNDIYTSNFYNTPSPLRLRIQAPQNFLKGSKYDDYGVAIGDKVFVKDSAGNEIYSRELTNVETYYFPDMTATYLVEVVEIVNGKSRRYESTLPNTNVLNSYDVLESYGGAGIWRDRYITIDASQQIIVGYYIHDGTYPEITFTGNIAVVQNNSPLKKNTVTDVVNRCLELIEPLQKG